jgi:hypothetical protein
MLIGYAHPLLQNIIYDGIVYHRDRKIFKTGNKPRRRSWFRPLFSPNNLYNS